MQENDSHVSNTSFSDKKPTSSNNNGQKRKLFATSKKAPYDRAN